MVTDGRWKLVWNLTDLCELYDLENDPHELDNRFYDPACDEVRAACFDYLLAEARRTGDAHVFLLKPGTRDGYSRDPCSRQLLVCGHCGDTHAVTEIDPRSPYD